MSILLHTNTKMTLCEDGLLVCPISCQPMMMVNYPIPDFRKMDPISYGHMMGKVVNNGIKKGQLIFSDSNTSEKILWFWRPLGPGRAGAYRRRPKIRLRPGLCPAIHPS